MRQILLSIMTIGIVAMLAGTGALAVFSDIEESKGNTFTAGELDLKIDWVETYNGDQIEMVPYTDDPGAIFYLDDVKPGDNGEATVSIHVFTNDAWVCMEMNSWINDEVSTNEPELAAGDVEDNPMDDWDGELAQNMNLLIWQEMDNNNVLDPGEPVLYEGKAEELPLRFAIDGDLEEEGVQPVVGCEDYYVGIKWWIPKEVGNIIQSDTFKFDMVFEAYQSRHNPFNPCGGYVIEYPAGENAYIGYEDREGGDFDYNDFGMRFALWEIYDADNNLKEVRMLFAALTYTAGDDHYIHIKRPFNGDYFYVVRRPTTPAVTIEKPEGFYAGSGDLDLVLYDTEKYTRGDYGIYEIVTVRVILENAELNPRDFSLVPPREFTDDNGDIFYDLDPMFEYYDPWMHDRNTGMSITIEDKQTGFGDEVPYILAVPKQGWVPPAEGVTMTEAYGYFDNFYNYSTPENWYEFVTDATKLAW